MSPCLDGSSSAIDVRKRPGQHGNFTTCWWKHFAAEQVFKDVDNIDPGDDFVERIAAAVGSCDVLLVLIGPQWLTISDENGHRRLDNPEDYVRLEIETALTRKIRVIPILVDDARIPRGNELPPTPGPAGPPERSRAQPAHVRHQAADSHGAQDAGAGVCPPAG